MFLSSIVPVAIATAKTINKIAVSRVEKRILASLFCMIKCLIFGLGKFNVFCWFELD